ncbi:unnamed protein product, partial [Phaeothamnion confervicola]
MFGKASTAKSALGFDRRPASVIGLHNAPAHGDDVDTPDRKRLAQQRFDEWVRRKENFDRSLQFFAKLEYSRWDEERAVPEKPGADAGLPAFRTEEERRAAREAGFFEVAVALAAIDRSLGFDLLQATAGATAARGTTADLADGHDGGGGGGGDDGGGGEGSSARRRSVSAGGGRGRA